MAIVLDALATRVMNTIMDMGEEKIHMLLGVSHEINKLQGNVETLRNLLTDAERRRITDKSVQAWVSKLKSAMYEADDILDLCQLEAMDRQDKQHSNGLCLRLQEKLPFLGCLGDKLQGILQPLLFCVKNPGFANEVGSRIKNLNCELVTIGKGVAGFNFNIDLGSYEERRRPLTSSAHPRRENAQFVESDHVGSQIKRNTEELVQKLIATGRHDHGSNNIVKMVAIVGQGGIGKSTLAKKVFASEAIKEEFKIKIWLSITQQFTKVDLLRAAISQAGGKHRENNDDETLLVQALTHALSKKKFLVVLDDVWNQEAWDCVLRVPVFNAGCEQPGSGVLVTTRNEDVVRSMGAFILRVNILNDEDAWCLLKKQLPQPQVGVGCDFDELKDIGMNIVKKSIEHVGPEFQIHDAARGDAGVAFPNLRKLWLLRLSAWKEWDWVEQQSKVIAFPALEYLKLRDCKLTHLPPGLASDRRQNLRTIYLEELTLLEYVENFPWVVELHVYSCPEIKRISGLAKLRTVDISLCGKLKLLEGVPVLTSMELDCEHWEVAGADAMCTRKRHQAENELPAELPEDFVISRNFA
ncbi:hypothetical protein ZWY2020_015075 [Hordeum vulgare]|nr:hypothetical protein ZWY2020_015075 [Hordeum vulgare]